MCVSAFETALTFVSATFATGPIASRDAWGTRGALASKPPSRGCPTPPSCLSACARSAERTLCSRTSRARASRLARRNPASATSSARRFSAATPRSRLVRQPVSAGSSAALPASRRRASLSAMRARSAADCAALGRFPGTGWSSCLASALSSGSAASAAAPAPSGRSAAARSAPTSPRAPAATSGQHVSTMSTPSAKHSAGAPAPAPAPPVVVEPPAPRSSGETYRRSLHGS